MSTSIEIEVESEDKCNGNCACKGEAAQMTNATPAPTKDDLLAELKKLLAITAENGRAERQLKIDELIGKINEYGQQD